MELSSQLVLRNFARLRASDILLFDPPPDSLFRELAEAGFGVSLWCQDYADCHWLRDQQAQVEFGVLPAVESVPKQVILFQPKEKDRLDLLLHFLAQSVPADGCIWLVGENRAGIKSAGRRLDNFYSSTSRLDAARHCVLFSAQQASHPAPFRLSDYRQNWLLASPSGDLRMVSLPGTFAHGRMDAGTGFLLRVVQSLEPENRPAGSVLDFGCGNGIIGIYLLHNNPSLNVTLLDNSALSLEAARLSLLANSLSARLLPSDGLRSVTQRFDWLVSNPPFHRGVAARYDTAQQFFAAAPGALTRNGRMLIVCNQHLPYETWLSEHFAKVELLEKQNRFKVLQASGPKA